MPVGSLAPVADEISRALAALDVDRVRAKAESLGAAATVGPAPREARVVVLLLGLAAWALFGENELYLIAVAAVAALALVTFVQRVAVTARALDHTKEGA